MQNPQFRRHFTVDFRMLAILLVLSVVPLALGTWFLVRNYQDVYLETVGTGLAQAADLTLNRIDGYIQDQIIETAAITEVPTLRDAVAKGNLDLTRNLDEVRKAIQATEARWAALDGRAREVTAVLGTPASDFLRRYAAVHRSYREIIVTDFLGRVVAATGKPGAYHLAGTEWWKETYGDGRTGTVYVGDVGPSDTAHVQGLPLAQPFIDPQQGVIGVLKVTIDAAALDALVGSVHPGDATAALIRAAGAIISAPGYSALHPRTFPGTLDLLTAREKGRRFTNAEGSVYGLPLGSLQQNYPRLNWIVTVSRPLSAIEAPLVSLRRHLLAMVLAVVAMAVLAALLLSRVESAPIVEQDPHLERL